VQDSFSAAASRSPVIAGTGQAVNKDDDRIVHPLVLLEEAARVAIDAASVIPAEVGAVFATPLSALVASDPSDVLAERLGAGSGPRVVSRYSGAAPQRLLAAACRAVAEGTTDVALVVGGIADASVRRARRRKIDPPALPTSLWSQGSDRPEGLPKRSWEGGYRPEIAAGAGLPSSYFALVQSALDRGRTRAEQEVALGRMLAPFSEVAALRPSLAWFPTVRTPAEIAQASSQNRLVAEPYTKLMCSFPTVDMAAAVVVTTAARRKGAGIRPLSIVCTSEAGPPSRWQRMDRSVALRMAAGEAFRLAGATPGDVQRYDLYSCFPAAVLVAVDALGLDPNGSTPLTATGGLPYFGGPGASYSLHGLACLFEDMEAGGVELGAAVSVGGMLTDFSLGVYGLTDTPFGWAELDAPEHAVSCAATTAEGVAVVDAATVLHDRDRGPIEAPLIARLASGERIGARCAEPTMAAELSGRNLVGAEVDLTTLDGKVFYRLRNDGL
jgi:acetyl-CoA C-acetyltransferase